MANQGIDHAAHRDGGDPLCGNRNGLMSVSVARFETASIPCKRCAAKLEKLRAMAARRSEKKAVRS